MPRPAILPLCLLLIAAALVADEDGARAQEPTTVPRHSSGIIATYTYRGVPFITTVTPLQVAYVNGELCGTGGIQPIHEAFASGAQWPWEDRAPCNQTGTTVRLCESVCTNEFIYEGEDVTVDLPYPEEDIPVVTAHFEHEGVTQPATVREWAFSAGDSCVRRGGNGQLRVTVTAVSRWWPSVGPCSTLGGEVVAQFTTDEFGEIEGSFTWNGADIDYLVDTGRVFATATPTSSPTPTTATTANVSPTAGAAFSHSSDPVQLPVSGGRPTTNSSSSSFPAAMVAIAAIGAGTWILVPRVRRP